MKLCVHFIAHGSYWKAGDEIPIDEIPPAIRKYAVNGPSGNGAIPAAPKMRTSSQAEASAEEPKQKLWKRYVKRGVAWRRGKGGAAAIGEPLFTKEGGQFVETGKVKA